MEIVKIITSTLPDPTVGCSGGYCPSFLLTNDGQVLVQGYIVAPHEKNDLSLPTGEDIVRIPMTVLEGLIKNLNHE